MNNVTKKISRNFGIVPTGHHKGAVDFRNKNMPDDSGIITFSSGLGFLYREKEKKAKTKTPNSFLMGVLHCDEGLDPVKKRLNFYGLFGKASQNSPSKKFEHGELKTIFIFGGKVTNYQIRRLDEMIASIERSLGDTSATAKNHKNSDKYQEALKIAETSQILVQAKFDSQYFSVDEEDESRASLSVGYVSFGTGKKPMVTNLDSSDSDDFIDVTIRDKETKADPMDFGAISLSTTRSYLKNFGGSDSQNLRLFTSDDGQFWSATVGSFKVEDLPDEFFKNFSQEVVDQLLEQDYIRFSTTLKSAQDIDSILNLDENGDAMVVVTGQIQGEDDGSSGLQFYTSEPDEDGVIRKTATFKVRQQTIYTAKRL